MNDALVKMLATLNRNERIVIDSDDTALTLIAERRKMNFVTMGWDVKTAIIHVSKCQLSNADDMEMNIKLLTDAFTALLRDLRKD